MIDIHVDDSVLVGCGQTFPYEVEVGSTATTIVEVTIRVSGNCQFCAGGSAVSSKRRVPPGSSWFHFSLCVTCNATGPVSMELDITAVAEDGSSDQEFTHLELDC